MKRDWDLLREQLTDIEDEKDFLADFPDEPKWDDGLSWEEFEQKLKEYRAVEKRIFGHLEMLVDNGYVDGLQILRGAGGEFHYGLSDPRLTMAGHDLLGSMRSQPVWETIKATAKTKGIELSFDAIKALAAFALKQLL
jgi:hypothetical protein